MTHRISSYSEYIDQVCKIHKTINKYKILAMYVQINVSKSKLLLKNLGSTQKRNQSVCFILMSLFSQQQQKHLSLVIGLL